MTAMYKLLTQEMTSYNDTPWQIGQTVIATGTSNRMCTDGVLHCYASPIQAALFNPVHANLVDPRLFRVECSEIVDSDGLKYACKSQTLLEELPFPEITMAERVAFAILCVLKLPQPEGYKQWAEGWLNGTDRTKEAAEAAAWAAATAARAAAEAAAEAATAAWAAPAAEAAAAEAARAAWAAAWAAEVEAAEAAEAAVHGVLDFDSLYTKAKEYVK